VSAELVVVAALAVWLYLLLGRGFFWRGAERDDKLIAADKSGAAALDWPPVTAIVPARNEAQFIARSVGSLLRQTYRGRFAIVLVDDQSSDGTAEIAMAAAREASAPELLTVVRGSDPPAGWTGKLWAMNQGFQRANSEPAPPDYLLFTDADIAYGVPDVVERLVRGARARGSMLTSLMVKLRCCSLAERMLVPAFIFFFAKLYPFAWVNDPRRRTAAAAGGCMLVKRDALTAAGGLQAIRGALIDDCALAALLKRQGPIWLGLTERVASLRPYPGLADFRRMVVRSAYTELRHSPLRLAGTLAGMTITYLAPPLLALFATGPAAALGAATWALMALVYVPTLRFYDRSPLWAVALPLVAAIYTTFTLESAVQHWRGRGGAWKGRFQAASAGRVA
jgi:hopene-associated glycosyltransferase HpnB